MSLLYRIDGTTQPQTLEDCLSNGCDKCCYNHLVARTYIHPWLTRIDRCQVMDLLWELAPKDEDGIYVGEEDI